MTLKDYYLLSAKLLLTNLSYEYLKLLFLQLHFFTHIPQGIIRLSIPLPPILYTI